MHIVLLSSGDVSVVRLRPLCMGD